MLACCALVILVWYLTTSFFLSTENQLFKVLLCWELIVLFSNSAIETLRMPNNRWSRLVALKCSGICVAPELHLVHT